MYHISFMHSLVHERFGCFHLLAFMNNALMNIHVHISVWTYVFFTSLSYMPKSRRDFETVFQSGCTILHSYQQYMRVLISLHLHQNLVSIFFIKVIPVGMKWFLLMVLICIFLMANDFEHLSMCFMAICISSLEKWLFIYSHF